MKKKLFKRVLLVVFSIIIILIGSVVVIPLFIFPKTIEGLSPVSEVKKEEGKFATIPFAGTDGLDIHYVEKNEKGVDEPVFILLHGSMYNLYSWNLVIDKLATKGRVIAYDQLPYGLSEKLVVGDWEKENPYTQEAAVTQLIEFLDTLGIEQVYLVGSSYGGTLSVRTAIEYKERVAGLILVDPAVFVNESMPEWIVNSKQMSNVGPLFARSIGGGEAFYKSCYSDSSVFSGQRKIDSMIMSSVNNWDFALWEYLKAWSISTFDFENRVSEVKQPVLIIAGSEDKVIPSNDFLKLDNILSNSVFEIIPGTGHMPQEESPIEFLNIVLPWIDENISRYKNE